MPDIPVAGCAMRKLNYDLWKLQQGRRDGSHGTRRERSYALAQMANTLHERGYPGLRARNLKGRHIEALVRDWFDRGLADATMMNRMAHLRQGRSASRTSSRPMPSTASASAATSPTARSAATWTWTSSSW